MQPATNRKVLRLLDRALIGFFILIVMVLLGIQAVHAAGARESRRAFDLTSEAGP